MKILKLILALLLALTLGVFGYTQVTRLLSHRGQGPEFQCDEETLEISVNDNRDILLEGITARDEQDGDLTDQILIQGISPFTGEDTATVTYLVFDSDGNCARYERPIRYTDYESPQFAITAPLTYSTEESVLLLDRIRVSDSIDGDITHRVRISAPIPTADSEIFTVDLAVSNSMGDTAKVTLPILRLENPEDRPQVFLTAYLIYLEQGSTFHPEEYLLSVTTPDGRGELSDVIITGSADTDTPGSYMIYYRYPGEDAVGLAVLTVVVEGGAA